MTEEEHKAAWNEVLETGRWLNEETNRIIDKLQKAQGGEYRIDDPRNRTAFKTAHEEFARRMKAIGKKYGLIKEEQ